MDFDQYADATAAAAKGFDAWLRGYFNRVVQLAWNNVRNLSPVDTGHMHRNWYVSEIYREGDNYCADIYNPVEYTQFVEYGHRKVDRSGAEIGWVNGRFMLTMSVAQAWKYYEDTWQKEFTKYLKSHGLGD